MGLESFVEGKVICVRLTSSVTLCCHTTPVRVKVKFHWHAMRCIGYMGFLCVTLITQWSFGPQPALANHYCLKQLVRLHMFAWVYLTILQTCLLVRQHNFTCVYLTISQNFFTCKTTYVHLSLPNDPPDMFTCKITYVHFI